MNMQKAKNLGPAHGSQEVTLGIRERWVKLKSPF